MEFDELFPKKKLNDYISDVFDGIHTGFEPSVDLFIATTDYLDDGLFEGFGQILFEIDPDTPDAEMLRELRDNVHVFSAFKSHHSAELLGEVIFDNEGIKRSFKDFRVDAMQMFNLTHDTHLKTEFVTSVSNGRSAAQWLDVIADADVFPFMKYSTIGDERVRPDHADFDGIVRPINDKFWKTHFPPNGFRCRCDASRMTGDESGFKQTSKKALKAIPDPPALFKMNAGIDRVVFDPKHPAFTVADRFKVVAKRNFDLPLFHGKHADTK